tara:strand:+ start:276 stop:686 length:411 start_codon:yes stop_codon:yes gene_type:complete
MTKCKISIKNDDLSARSLLLPHKKKVHDNFLKDVNVSIYSITYNDFDYDQDEYVETEVKVINSDADFKYHNTKENMYISLENATIEVEFDSGDQEEKFIDKDWEYESFTLTINLKGTKLNEFINYTDSELFLLEIL